ncbi:MAG TPA: glycosyltransferase [Kiritimatiellia bacterium]|nr:glycosyltransferase [Kiritimatiellia bacterium]
MNAPTPKRKLGCWLHERWRMELVLRAPGLARRLGLEWADLCNRHERIEKISDGVGRICRWQDSSFLTACRLFPATGARLLRHVWRGRAAGPASPVSVILPVRGEERREAVAFVVETLRRMAGAESEILVCEHDVAPRYARDWPRGVRHLFAPAAADEAFNKSKAMNAGARAARNPILILLDADAVPSPDFLARAVECLDRGWEAVRPLRFLFLLDAADSREFMRQGSPAAIREVAFVHQNNPGLVAVVRRETYVAIGGHDERFAGWGGEDLEFLDRLRTRQLYPGSFLPAIHLWHPPAPQKLNGHRNNELLRRVMAEATESRVARNRRQWEGAAP